MSQNFAHTRTHLPSLVKQPTTFAQLRTFTQQNTVKGQSQPCTCNYSPSNPKPLSCCAYYKSAQDILSTSLKTCAISDWENSPSKLRRMPFGIFFFPPDFASSSSPVLPPTGTMPASENTPTIRQWVRSVCETREVTCQRFSVLCNDRRSKQNFVFKSRGALRTKQMFCFGNPDNHIPKYGNNTRKLKQPPLKTFEWRYSLAINGSASYHWPIITSTTVT